MNGKDAFTIKQESSANSLVDI